MSAKQNPVDLIFMFVDTIQGKNRFKGKTSLLD